MSELDTDIAALLERHTPAIRRLATRLVATVRAVRPDLTPRVRRGWGSVNFRHPVAGFVCAVVPVQRQNNVVLVFEYGRLLDSPLLIDDGKVKQVRWIPFRPGASIPVDDIAILLAEAIALRS